MNLENISDRVKKISKDTVKEVQKMNEIHQLNSQVNQEKKKIDSVYTQIGKKVCDLYKEEPLQEFESEIASVEESMQKIEELQEKVRSVKGVVLCPCCGMEVSIGERFCSNCGYQMPETEDEEPEDVTEETAEESTAEESSEETAEESAAEEPSDESAEEEAEKPEDTAEE